MSEPGKRALSEGLVDAAGFFVGALAAATIARSIGFDFLEPGYGPPVLVGLMMVGVGGGVGLQVARWIKSRFDRR
jgi:hypothetical protein